jgi:hypothetical protein
LAKKQQKIKEVSVQADLDTRDPIVVSVNWFKEKPRFDIRHYFENESGEMTPSKKGLNIPLEQTLQLIDAILTAYNEATGSSLAVFEAEDES